MKKNSPLLLIVSSPSGAGKTTLCRRLLEEFDSIRFSISHTTRPARPEEVDGKDYNFVTDEQFDEMVEGDRFIEWAHVHASRYGTARAEIRAAAISEQDLVFDVDFQGARMIKEQYPNAVGIFVLPPSIEELQRRVRSRGTESNESLERRFKAALEEIRNAKKFDYHVVNDDLETAYTQIRSILIAERVKQHRTHHPALELLGVEND